MKIDLFVSHYERMIGLARYTASIQKYLSRTGIDYQSVEPAYPLMILAAHTLLKPFGFGVKDFFNIFPISAQFRQGSIKHFSHQMMASMLSFHKNLGTVIITVHDIVPYMMRDDPTQNVYRRFYDRWIDHKAMNNLRKANGLIAISGFTKKMLVEHLGCSEEKIHVVLYGLDHEIFKPVRVTEEFYARYKVNPNNRYLLYVGSENPRKNLASLIEAFSKVKEKIPNVKLLKVGTPEYLVNYRLLQKQIHEHGLDQDVIFINHPSQEDLVAFYCAADIFVFPSFYEGFGMPPLEAMACGTPVICSNATSLPEVVGDAAVLLDPRDIQGWAEAILEVMTNDPLREELRVKSLARANKFTWEKTARETIAVYEKINQTITSGL